MRQRTGKKMKGPMLSQPRLLTGGPVEDARTTIEHGDNDIASLRKKCKNTSYVAGHVMSVPDLQFLSRLIYKLVRPFYTAHADHARDAHQPAELQKYYLDMARGPYLNVFISCVKLLSDLE